MAELTRVLVVDDDALVLTNTRAMLEDLGHTAIGASSGAEALVVLHARHDIELVLTDHAMPKVTGAQLSALIRRERPDLPILLATGYSDAAADVRGDFPILRKPYEIHQLSQAIAKLPR